MTPLLTEAKIANWLSATIARLVTVGLIPAVFLAGGCSSSSTKDLTESSAQKMIQAKLSGDYFPIPIDAALALPQPTRTDFKGFNGTGSELLLKRLLDLGVVDEHVSVVSYPNVSGTFTGELGDPVQTKCKMINQYHLTMDSGSNTFTGTSRVSNTCQTGNSAPEQRLSGHIDENGKVVITWGLGWQGGTFAVMGNTGNLTMPGPWYMGPEWHMSGPGNPQKENVTWYTYSLSPNSRNVKKADGRTQVDAGTYRVGEVSNLQLASDTVAVAQFAWKVSPNRVGNALLGEEKPQGIGHVEFGKKPDGSWFITQWSPN